MRRVEYKTVDGALQIGFFHGFSLDHEEFETGPGHYPVAIIETTDGHIILEYAKHVRLLDAPQMPKEQA